MKQVKRKDLMQFVRYLMVGVINTLVTLLVIYICKSIIGVNLWVSNFIGYVAGVINSFLWNKLWVFHSHGRGWQGEGLKFLIGFVLCYGLQFAATWLLTTYVIYDDFLVSVAGFSFSGYGVATVIGMMVYTMANFVYNRLVTFRQISM